MNPFYALALSSLVLASSSQILLKKSAAKTWPSTLRQYLNVYVIAGYGMLGFSMILGLLCYRFLGYMETVILEPVGYILVFLFGRIVFAERFTPRKVGGICLIIAGILVFNLC